ncbi:hypothetical protein F5Y18DRAFT_215667 [Xylariaceae sp. FL1019]|nr:hypothetical protein F5Y18DRAFT_215667 [Xylariaceae sp. FL1019]
MTTATRQPRNNFVAFARKIYNSIGFEKGYNFALCVIFLGAFFAFTLFRLPFLNFYGTFCSPNSTSILNHASAGECFYWLQPYYSIGIRMHLYGVLFASLLACIQFIPVVRHKATWLHRMNGYMVIVLSIVAVSGVFMILPRSFGGGVDTISAGGCLGVAFLLAQMLAYANIKRLQIDQHRAWMLRAWVWAGCIITTRGIMFASIYIPASLPRYYAMPCDKIHWMLGSVNTTLALYPQCEAFFSGTNLHQNAVTLATCIKPSSVVEVAAALDLHFGMALWLAFAIHAAGIEIYLHLTSTETGRLRRISYERQLAAGMKHPGSAGLTTDRLDDVEKWRAPKSSRDRIREDQAPPKESRRAQERRAQERRT